ncbi:MAG: hypothetical protein LBH11_05970, partial [Propionibacteriaceae bacterium]|nr:hypothetical protein [Propionibacteriaceae bacterium]
MRMFSHSDSDNAKSLSHDAAPRWSKRGLAIVLAAALGLGLAGLNASGDPTDPSEPVTSETTTSAPSGDATTSDPTSEPEVPTQTTEPVEPPESTEESAETPAEPAESTETPAEHDTPAAPPAQQRPAPRNGGSGDFEINPNLTCTVNSGTYDVLAGQSVLVKLALSASGLSTAAGAGMLLVVPVMQDSSHTDAPNIGDAGAQYVENYAIPGTDIVLDKALLIWKLALYGSFTMPNATLRYTFDNGITPDEHTFPVQVYCFEAEGIAGQNAFGTGVVAESGYNHSSEVTLTSRADEVWSVSQYISSTSNPSEQVFPDLLERSYVDVVTDGDAEDNHTITYRLTVSSNKPGGSFGRLFMNNIHVSDTLSGFLASGVPTSITVQEVKTGNVRVGVPDVVVTEPTADTRQIEFDVPDVSTDAYSGTRTFEVTVVFDKDDYTNRYGESAILTEPQSVSNTVSVSYTPVTTNVPATTPGGSTEVAFGWVQQQPTLPSLTISQILHASGTDRYYTVEMAKSWEGDSDLSAGDLSNVEFTLARVRDGAASSKIEVYPQDRRTARLVLYGAESLATFADLEPGWYRLWQSDEISDDVKSAHDNLVNGLLVEVSVPDATGLARLYVDGTEYRLPTDYLDFRSDANQHGYIKVYTKRQQLFMHPATYVSFHGSLGLYTDASATTEVLVADYAGTDAGGDYLIFENIQYFATFYVRDKSGDPDWALHSIELHDPTAPTIPTTTDQSVTVAEPAALNVYTAFLQSNYGGFRAGKLLQNPDGTFSTQNFVATYNLYPVSGDPFSGSCATTALQDAVNGGDVTFTLNNSTVNYVGKELPSGTYCVREVSLRSSSGTGGVDLSTQYALYQGDNLRLTITAGSYGGQFFLGSAPGEMPTLNAQPAGDSGLRPENIGVPRHVNVSRAGQLAIRNFNGTGALQGVQQYRIVKTDFNSADDGWWDSDGVLDVTIPNVTSPAINQNVGDWRGFVPVGTYTIEPINIGASAVLIESMGGNNIVTSGGSVQQQVTVNVVAGTPATPIADAVKAPGGAGNASIDPTTADPASVQTAAFLWRYKPIVTVTKQRVSASTGANVMSGMGNARFALYRLNDGATEYVFHSLLAAPDGSGVVRTPNLTAGTYLLVETTLTSSTNYMKPEYFTANGGESWFKTTSGYSVPKATAESYIDEIGVTGTLVDSGFVKKIEITSAHYVDLSTQPNTHSWGTMLNVPLNTVTITKRDASSSAGIVTSLRLRCTAPGSCPDGTTAMILPTNSSGVVSFSGLKPGTYYLEEYGDMSPYVASGAAIEIVIDERGKPTVSWVGTPPSGSSQIPGVTASNGTTQNTISAVWTNIKRPDIRFEKRGQLMEWDDDGGRVSQPLEGACFVLWDDLGQYYEVAAGSNNVVLTDPQPGSVETATQICSNEAGMLNFNQIDPLRKYWLEEVVVPPIPGENASGLSYNAIEQQFSFAWRDASSNPSRAAGYYLVRGHDNEGDDSNFWAPRGNGSGTYYTLTNRVNEFHIELWEVPIKLHDTESGVAGGFDGDFRSMFGETEWDGIVVTDSWFAVYLYDEDAPGCDPIDPATCTTGAPVDNIEIGAGDVEGGNRGWSRGLPAGKYVVVKTKMPYSYSAPNSWIPADAQGDQTTSLYYQNTRPSGIDAEADTDWKPVPDHLGVLVELGQHPADNPDTEWNEGNRQLTFGNSNRAPYSPSALGPRLVRNFVEKDGFRLDVALMEYVRDTRLGGIEFDVFPAYLTSEGKYEILPTFEDAPIATARSRDWGDAELRQGQFITEYYNITEVFYCSPLVGGACEDWGVFTWDPATDDANGDEMPDADEVVYRYHNYPINTSPDGSIGATLDIGGVVPGMIDWDGTEEGHSPVPNSVRYAYANERTQWSVVFVEKPKEGCDLAAPDPGNPTCSPLPNAYEWDPANPPTFGITMDNSGTLFTTYYGNGNSGAGTPPCEIGEGCETGHEEPAPVIFPNYRGTGWLTVNTFSEVLDGVSGEHQPLAGATYELYAIDPAYAAPATLDTPEGRAAALEHATLVTGDRQSGSDHVSVPFTAGPLKSLKLSAGVYLLVQTGVPAGFNAYGDFSSTACPDSVNECEAGLQPDVLDREGSFQSGA